MVRELLGSYEILHEGSVIARHRSVGQHQVVLEPGHYAGLLRPRGSAPPDVTVRDLGVYAAIAEEVVR